MYTTGDEAEEEEAEEEGEEEEEEEEEDVFCDALHTIDVRRLSACAKSATAVAKVGASIPSPC